MKYRGLGSFTIIEAFRWTGDYDQTEDPEWIAQAIREGKATFLNDKTPDVKLVIKTLEGSKTVSPGDWVVRLEGGNLQRCTDQIFHRFYKPIE